jgi:divalent metal cation (Fe/Co/Zn/Cd) transporter
MRAALLGLLINLSLVLDRLLAGIAGHSYALVADGVSAIRLATATNQIIVPRPRSPTAPVQGFAR